MLAVLAGVTSFGERRRGRGIEHALSNSDKRKKRKTLRSTGRLLLIWQGMR
jgi:hypothetical protein